MKMGLFDSLLSSSQSLLPAPRVDRCPSLKTERRGFSVRYYFRRETSWICAKSNCARRLSTRRRTKFSSILWPNWWTRTSLIDFITLKHALKDRSQLYEIGGPELLHALLSLIPFLP